MNLWCRIERFNIFQFQYLYTDKYRSTDVYIVDQCAYIYFLLSVMMWVDQVVLLPGGAWSAGMQPSPGGLTGLECPGWLSGCCLSAGSSAGASARVPPLCGISPGNFGFSQLDDWISRVNIPRGSIPGDPGRDCEASYDLFQKLAVSLPPHFIGQKSRSQSQGIGEGTIQRQEHEDEQFIEGKWGISGDQIPY